MSPLRFCVTALFILCLYVSESNQLSITVSDVDDGQEVCRFCPIGTYSGTFTNQEGKIENCSIVCEGGSCPAASNCTDCAAGTYSDMEKSTACLQCDVGFVSREGAYNCSGCPAGSSSNSDNTGCAQCSPGTVNPQTGAICLHCPMGTFFPSFGGEVCQDCPKGTFASEMGRTACTPCGIGSYNPEITQTESSACLICPTGYYCPFVATDEPQPCPADSYCKAGASQPTSCQALFESDPTSESCQPKPTLYLLMLAAIAAIVVVAGVIVCLRNSRKKSQSRAFPESARLIPEPKHGPVYQGL